MAERRFVTQKDIDDITKMFAANMSVDDVASITGFCSRTVRKIRDGAHELQIKSAALAETPKTVKEAQPAPDYHNDLLMIYSAIADIRDGLDALLKEYGIARRSL